MTSSIFSSAGDFSLASAFAAMDSDTLLTVSSNHALTFAKEPPPGRACFFVSAFSASFCSALATLRPASSACRKSLKYLPSLSSSCAASRTQNFSSSRRRDSTKSALKRPTTAFSGSGGTMDPGTSFCSMSCSHTKSL